MKILILDSYLGDKLEEVSDEIIKLKNIIEALENNKQEVSYLSLVNMEIKDCIGCYACWLKTPGICVWDDDMPNILESYLKADCVILLSPVKMNFISTVAKRYRDRLLPLVHPYLTLKNDRMGHLMRYEHQPKQFLLLSSDQKSEAIESIYGDPSSNKRTILYMTEETECVIHEIINS